MAYEQSEKTPGQGHCHREPIKGHVVIDAPKIDLRISSTVQNKANYKIVPSFPPTLENLWCMAFVPTPETMQEMKQDDRLKKDGLNS